MSKDNVKNGPLAPVGTTDRYGPNASVDNSPVNVSAQDSPYTMQVEKQGFGKNDAAADPRDKSNRKGVLDRFTDADQETEVGSVLNDAYTVSGLDKYGYGPGPQSLIGGPDQDSRTQLTMASLRDGVPSSPAQVKGMHDERAHDNLSVAQVLHVLRDPTTGVPGSVDNRSGAPSANTIWAQRARLGIHARFPQAQEAQGHDPVDGSESYNPDDRRDRRHARSLLGQDETTSFPTVGDDR